MKDAVLIELANRWDAQAVQPEKQDGSENAKIPNAKEAGRREAKRECADTIRMLISLIGEQA